jgi:hypothetical protein
MTTTSLTPTERVGSRAVSSRLAVAWQHPDSRLIEPVGVLSCDDEGFAFGYLAQVARVDGFRPFIGFPDLGRRYRSPRLFPIFAQRVMRPGRPDYRRHLQTLSLDPDANQWEVLARSQGQRQGDGIRLFAEPDVRPEGRTSATFFVSGLRYRAQQSPEVEAAVSGLAAGDQLALRPEPDNPSDPRALLLTDGGEVALGWVPHVLLDYVRTTMGMPEPSIVTVLAVQPPTAIPSYRLLVRLTGHFAPGGQAFDGPQWELAETAEDEEDARVAGERLADLEAGRTTAVAADEVARALDL